MNHINVKGITTSTKVRILSLIVVLLNQSVAAIGMTTFAQELWYQIFSIVATVVVSSINAWYNNDITHYAMISTKVYDALKAGTVCEEDLDKLILKGEAYGSAE